MPSSDGVRLAAFSLRWSRARRKTPSLVGVGKEVVSRFACVPCPKSLLHLDRVLRFSIELGWWAFEPISSFSHRGKV
jgi:hypothetical protein